MGYFRCLSKPIKRYFFAYADKVTQKFIIIVSNKYTLKYINKLNKLNNNPITNELIDSSQYYTIPGLVKFVNDLENDLNKEKGIAHSKVREYWLRRGPRLLIILILTIFITVGLAILLIDISYKENIYSILIGINMILFNIYMLYERLIDSISGTMMKIGHDHYKKWKKELTDNSFTVHHIKITHI